jgi:hypothetical protein
MSWPPLWEYVCAIGHGLIDTRLAVGGYHDRGYELDARTTQRLAERLRKQLEAGNTENYIASRAEALARLPDLPCDTCNGSEGGCEDCGFTGQTRPAAACYVLNVQIVKDFVAFIEHSGGFSI